MQGHTVHAGPSNTSDITRYVLYMDLLPDKLINDKNHDSNDSAVLEMQELLHFNKRQATKALYAKYPAMKNYKPSQRVLIL